MFLELAVGALSVLAAGMLFYYGYAKMRSPGSIMFKTDAAQNLLVLSIIALGVLGVAYLSMSLLRGGAA